MLGPQGSIGQVTAPLGLGTLPLSFAGLVVGSALYSLPFVVQPVRNAFEAMGNRPMEVAATLRALLSDPKLLLMDEPLSALDHAAKAAILPYFERLHNELRLPVPDVSHDSDEVARLADRMVLLEDGRMKASGPVSKMMTSLKLPMSGYDNASAILGGIVTGHDETYHLTHINCAGNRISLPRIDLPSGSHTQVQVHARDVSLSLSAHSDTSIGNIIPAVVVGTREIDAAQSLVELTLEDGQTLLARITRHSGVELGIAEDKLLYAQIKSIGLPG